MKYNMNGDFFNKPLCKLANQFIEKIYFMGFLRQSLANRQFFFLSLTHIKKGEVFSQHTGKKEMSKMKKHTIWTVIIFVLNILPTVAQQKLTDAIQLFNQNSDSTIYYNVDHVLNISNETCCHQSFGSINDYLVANGFVVITYSPKQFVIIEKDKANLSFGDLLGMAAISSSKNDNTQHFIINNGGLSNGIAQIKGIIKDQNDEPIIGANIITNKDGLGSSTDIDGRFSLDLNPGTYMCTVSAIGFSDKSIRLTVSTGGNITIIMLSEATQLGEIVVTERSQGDNVRSKIVGLKELSVKQMKLLPSLMGQVDILKSLTILAGVNTNPDGIGGLNIRGSNPDQNLVVQNDMVYYNPTHALGFVSSFIPEFVSKVQLYKGYIPPKYGGRVSAVINSETKTGHYEKYKSKLNLGFTNSGIFFEGPIHKNTTSFAVGGRLAHANWLLNFINVPENQKSRLNFYDVHVKIDHKIGPKSNIGIEGYTSNDHFLLLGDVSFDYQTQNLQVYYRSILSKNTNLTVKILTSDYKSTLNQQRQNNDSRFSSGIKTNSALLNILTTTSIGNLRYGIDVNQYTITPGQFSSQTTANETFSLKAQNETSLEVAPHMEMSSNITTELSVTGGARLVNFLSYGPRSFYTYTDDIFEADKRQELVTYSGNAANAKYYSFEPRLGIVFQASKNTSIKTGVTRNFQYLNQISNSLAATPVDFWKSSDFHFQPIRSDNLYLGLYQDFFKNQYEFSSEVYYTKLTNLQEYKDFADLLGNEFLETEVLFGHGKNYGMEFSLKKIGGTISGNISYTYSRSWRQVNDPQRELINNGEWYPSIVDKPHNLNFLINFNVNKRLSFNFNFAYITGRPITVPVNKYEEQNIGNILYFGDRNTYRIPDYHRLDFSMNILPAYSLKKKFKYSWNFTILNLYGRKNPYSVFFQQNKLEPLYAYKYSILGIVLPSLSLNIEM